METRRHLMLVGVIACIASLAAFFFAGVPRLPRSTNPYDSGKNWIMAYNVAERGVFSEAIDPPYFPSARRMPLYSLFLAGLIKLNASPHVALAVQYALSIAVPILTYFLAREFLSARASVIVGILMALHPTELAMPSTFDDAWFFEIFWLAGFLYFVRALKSEHPMRAMIFVGIFFGVSGLIRPLTMALWPVFLVGALWMHRRRAIMALAVFVLILATIWTPWFYRNWRTFHEFFITTQDAYILAWDSFAWYLADTQDISHQEAKHRVRLAMEERVGRSLPYEGGDAIDDPFLNEPALAAETKRYVFSQIARDPLRYAVSNLRHSLPFWTGSSLREFLASTPWYPSALVATRPNLTSEITAGHWSVARAEFARLGPALALYVVDFLIFSVILYVLAAMGLVVLLRSRTRVPQSIAGVLFVIFIIAPLITSGVYIGPRYRFPLEPFFLILAGIAVVAFRQSFKKYRHRAPRQVL